MPSAPARDDVMLYFLFVIRTRRVRLVREEGRGVSSQYWGPPRVPMCVTRSAGAGRSGPVLGLHGMRGANARAGEAPST
jgi:hypothetical protein